MTQQKSKEELMPTVHLLSSSVKLNAGKTKKCLGTIGNCSCSWCVNQFSKKWEKKQQSRGEADGSFAQGICWTKKESANHRGGLVFPASRVLLTIKWHNNKAKESRCQQFEVDWMLMVCSVGAWLPKKQDLIQLGLLFILAAEMLGIVFSQFCYLFLHCM